jgi:predicted nucleic acid-binding protein
MSANASVPEAERFLLDTSAILALTDQEEGFDTVEALLDRATSGEIEVAICAMSLMELFYITLQEDGEDRAARLVALIKAWPVRWIYPDEKTLLFAGRLKAFHHLSFADALIAGTAKINESVLVHKDPEFEDIGEEVSLLSLPYKRPR